LLNLFTITGDGIQQPTLTITATAPLVITSGQNPNLTITKSALTRTNDTNVTLTLNGSPSTALLAATSITAGWTGVLSTARGGTGPWPVYERDRVALPRALGAQGCYIGRAFLYGLGALGETGVQKVLEILHKELDLTMAFCGRTDIETVDKTILLPGTYPT
jgi:hypothetical protein